MEQGELNGEQSKKMSWREEGRAHNSKELVRCREIKRERKSQAIRKLNQRETKINGENKKQKNGSKTMRHEGGGKKKRMGNGRLGTHW